MGLRLLDTCFPHLLVNKKVLTEHKLVTMTLNYKRKPLLAEMASLHFKDDKASTAGTFVKV